MKMATPESILSLTGAMNARMRTKEETRRDMREPRLLAIEANTSKVISITPKQDRLFEPTDVLDIICGYVKDVDDALDGAGICEPAAKTVLLLFHHINTHYTYSGQYSVTHR
jgi:hypothetical protein